MNDRVVGALFLPLAGGFGWMLVNDYRRGRAELPRTGWVVDRRFDPALFWTFTAFNCLMLSVLLFAAAILVPR